MTCKDNLDHIDHIINICINYIYDSIEASVDSVMSFTIVEGIEEINGIPSEIYNVVQDGVDDELDEEAII